jgi:CBS domain-containing protein
VHARDLLDTGPVVQQDADALDVVTELVDNHWDGLVIVDGDSRALATVSLAQVLRLALASVYAERDADTFAETLRNRQVHEVMPRPKRKNPPVVVPPAATLLEVSALMAVHNTAIVAVVEEERTIGAVGAHAVMHATLPR